MEDRPSYTHKGLMYGIVPVYLDITIEDTPTIAGRNFACDVLLDICEIIFGILVLIRTAVDADYDPAYPIKITGAFNEN